MFYEFMGGCLGAVAVRTLAVVFTRVCVFCDDVVFMGSFLKALCEHLYSICDLFHIINVLTVGSKVSFV